MVVSDIFILESQEHLNLPEYVRNVTYFGEGREWEGVWALEL